MAAREELLRRARALVRGERDRRGGQDALMFDRESDPVDHASALAQVDGLEALTRQQSAELREIFNALDRIERGVYGTCLLCGDAIPGMRLQAMPSAALCTSCASQPPDAARL